MIGSPSGVPSVANSDFSWSQRSACNQSFPECLLSLSLSATYQVFTVTLLSRRTSKVFTAIPFQLVLLGYLPTTSKAFSVVRQGAAPPGTDIQQTQTIFGTSAYPPLKVTESHQLPGREPTPGSRGLDICWPPYSKVAAWPAS